MPLGSFIEALKRSAQTLPFGLIVCDSHRIWFATPKAEDAQLTSSDLAAILEGGWTEILSGTRLFQCTRLTLALGHSINIYIINDVSNFNGQIERLQRLCLTDELTGLYNRRGFVSVGTHIVEAARREDRAVHVVFADIDGLKSINDNLGHSYGDQAIVDFGKVLKSAVRSSDIVGRIGGDEFVILARGDADAMNKTIARLEQEIDKFNLANPRAYKLSASFGKTEIKTEDRPHQMDELLSEADASMYEEKRMKKRVFHKDNELHLQTIQGLPIVKAPEDYYAEIHQSNKVA